MKQEGKKERKAPTDLLDLHFYLEARFIASYDSSYRIHFPPDSLSLAFLYFERE